MRDRPRCHCPPRLARPLALLALASVAAAAAPPGLSWGIEERAARGCVEHVALQFHAVGALGSHPEQSLCGSTPVRLYPEPLPSGLLTVRFSNGRGEPRRYDIPLDAVFRRENVRMEGAALELVYGQDSVELWVRPLASPGGAAAADAAPARRIYSAGLELDAAPPRPGITRSR